jgi:hypothetical protein
MLRNFKILTQTFVLKKACLKQINIAKYVSTSAMQGPDQIVTSDTDVTTSADGYVKLRLGPKDDPSGLPPISVPSLLMKAAREAPDIPALTIKRDGKWVKWTYKEYHQGILVNCLISFLHHILVKHIFIFRGQNSGKSFYCFGS